MSRKKEERHEKPDLNYSKSLVSKSDLIFHIVKANHKLVKNTTPPQYIKSDS